AVEALAPLGQRDPRGHGGVPQAGAVQVHHQAVVVRPGADGLDFLQRIDAAAAAVVRVFQTHEPRAHQVFVIRTDLVLALADAQEPKTPSHRRGGAPRGPRRSARLVDVYVTRGLAQ